MFTVRSFSEEDTPKLTKLFQICYQKYSGFTIRNEARWLWEISKNPDVDEHDILVFLADREPVGYLVLGQNGYVLEMAYDPSRDASLLVTFMLSQTEQHARTKGVDRITLTVPSGDEGINTVLTAAGYREGPAHAIVSAKFTSPVDMLRRLADEPQFSVAHTGMGAFLLVIHEKPDKDASVLVLAGNSPNKPDIRKDNRVTATIYLQEDALTELLLGSTSPLKAILTGRVSVQPFHRIFKVHRFLRRLKFQGPFFIPFSDWA